MNIRELELTKEESDYIKLRFRKTKLYEGLKYHFPLFVINIDNLPDTKKWSPHNCLDLVFMDALCEARGLEHGSLR